MVFINGKNFIFSQNIITKSDIAMKLKLSTNEFYLLNNGKIVSEVENTDKCYIDLILRVNGGKGGFGSMLRAIGAQIEKTTNREACRDLSGRRLRDINEEKRLKAWISQQADREKESEDRKKKRLEKLCQQPKHEFKDEDYEKERSELTERVEDAILCGLSKDKLKRSPEIESKIKKKKPKLMFGASDEELSTSDDDSETENEDSKPGTSKSASDSTENKEESSNNSDNNCPNFDEKQNDLSIKNDNDNSTDSQKGDEKSN